jgi:P27 family predicted phage terminase small subunit
MAKPGPAPTPTSILKLNGSWRAKTRKDEPSPPKTRPAFPRWLTTEARKKWRETIQHLEAMNVLTCVDGDVVALYADTWAWLRRCRAFVEKHGESFPTYDEAGNLTGYKQYPQVSLAVKLAGQVARLEAELGLTPSGRTRLHTRPRAPEAVPDGRGAWRIKAQAANQGVG